MRFDTNDIAQAIRYVRASSEPIEETLASSPFRIARLRTAIGTTPPALRKPDTSDGVPTTTDGLDDAWLDLIDL